MRLLGGRRSLKRRSTDAIEAVVSSPAPFVPGQPPATKTSRASGTTPEGSGWFEAGLVLKAVDRWVILRAAPMRQFRCDSGLNLTSAVHCGPPPLMTTSSTMWGDQMSWSSSSKTWFERTKTGLF